MENLEIVEEHVRETERDKIALSSVMNPDTKELSEKVARQVHTTNDAMSHHVENDGLKVQESTQT